LKSILSILFFILVTSSYSQRPVIYNKETIEDPQIIFERLTIENGLSHNRVTDIIQDSHGFFWIATTDGLNRYDGKQFEIFRYNEDNYTSLTSSFVSCIAESRSGDIYIGTDHGLNMYNRSTNSFISVPVDKINQYPGIREIMFDNDSVLWIETSDGYLINFCVKRKEINKAYKHQGVNQHYYLYHDIYRDKDDVLWIGMRNIEPMYLDEESDKIISLSSDEYDYSKKRASDMACYYEDSYDNFWFTALDGIYLFDRGTEVFSKFLGTTTYDVIEDSHRHIWFATGSGVMKYDVDKNLITLMKNEKDNPNSISSNSVHKVMEDDVGNLWFATSIGVNIYSPPAYPFKHYTHIPGISNSPEGYVVTALAEDKDNKLWIGYENDGLDYFDKRTGRFFHNLSSGIKQNSIASNKVSALYFDDDNTLWIGLWKGIGFNSYNIDKKRFTLYTFDENSLERDWYNDFTEDNNGNFYIGFWGAKGLTRFDREGGRFLESFMNKFERAECSRLITDLLYDSNGSIWCGTTDCGLHRYFPLSNSAVSYFSDITDSHGLSSNTIASITEDKFGNIWIINDKLQKYIPENDTFVSYGYSNGLTAKDLSSLVADDNGDLWIGTKSKGLFRFCRNNLKFLHYGKQDGLLSNSFTDAGLKLRNGDIVLGCNNGFNVFNPKEIVPDNDVPVPFFGRLFIYDHIVSHDLNQETSVILEPDENVFSVELLGSDIVNPERYSYRCMLEGYDNTWVEIDNKQRLVRYAAVPPGNYLLKYSIGNRNGTWSEKTSSIRFKIEKPYYLTWWFIITLLIILGVIMFLIVKRRELDLKKKYGYNELQQRLFRLQMNPHFIYNSLLAIQNFIFLHNPKEAGNYLSDFARLFRLILNNSRSEFIKIGKEVETLGLYLKLQSLRYPDKFSYTIYLDPEIDEDIVMIPPMLAQPMIENALEHGLFYKKGKGHIEIRFEFKGNELLFEVKDNGVGLTKANERSSKDKEHKSTALDITRERIKILGKQHGFFSIFELEELKGSDGTVNGTMVRFNLPVKISIL
jgi:ligand-binding sensor domain-containing protein